ncbi:MAG TPA: prolyl oligopeptidase family serine peptidase [Candidatus Acidoferrales bacterium]|nr:prolyl oligopeptidase family serine peptidase [Candidatus Acidoferrales bacterium]
MRYGQRILIACVCVISISMVTAALPQAQGTKPAPATKTAPTTKAATPAKTGAAPKDSSTIKTNPSNEPFTIEQVLSFSFPEPTSMVTSARGDRIAWVSNTLGRRNIWGAEAPGWTARQITHYGADDGQEITELDFSSDGGLIAYVRGGDKNREGEIPDPNSDPAGVDQSVFTVAWSGAETHKVDTGHAPQVSPHSTASAGWISYEKDSKIWMASIPAGKPVEIYSRGENSEIEWAPDGKTFAFASNRASHSLIALYDVAKKSISYVTPTVDRDSNPRWSPDGKSIAFLRSPAFAGGGGRGGRGGGGRGGAGGGAAIWIYSLSGNEAHRVFQLTGGTGNAAVQHDVLNWAGDDRLVFPSEQDGWEHLYSVPAAGGEATLLTPGECEYEYMSFSPDRKNIFFNSNCGDIDRRHLWEVSASGGAPQAVTSGESIEWYPMMASSGKWLAYFASDAQHPATPFIRSFDAGKPSEGKAHAMMPLPKEFPVDKLVTPKQVVYNAADGTFIHGQLFLPAGLRAGEKRPAIIFMHGGPPREMLLGWHYMYYYSNSYGMNQYLTSHGYIVFSVNYRGGIGYGRDFRTAPNRGGQGASEYQDIVAGANYLRSRDDVDIARIGLWGGSYGGYLTAMGLARNSDLFAAGVDLHGVHDWSTQSANNALPPGVTVPPLQLDTPAARLARESSPVASISTWRSPVLLIQGDDDRNVIFTQMIELVPMLRQQGVPFEQIVFPDEVHDFLMWRSWVHAYHAGSDFFDRKLKSGASGATSSAGGN